MDQLISFGAPVQPVLFADCSRCTENGEVECSHHAGEVRWDGEAWSCEECWSPEDRDLWASAPTAMASAASSQAGASEQAPDDRDQIIRDLVALHMRSAKHLPEKDNISIMGYLQRKGIAPSPFRAAPSVAANKANEEPQAASEEVKTYLEGVTGVVEANSFESLYLWEENQRLTRREWVSTRHGFGPCIGQIDGRPIAISLMTATIDGQKILFLDATSVLIDWHLIDAWLEKNLPQSARLEDRINRTDALNFQNIFHRPANKGRSDDATPDAAQQQKSEKENPDA
ncbi:hypothetical protein ACEUZ9_005475 [Paracoccus litorisediminis]|uniref:hypothetical protein n=1 Tax=Paracoccus litorisediminis TaxID=2006130 RepID=UPI003732B7A6